MADFRTLARHHPAVRTYLRHRRWIDRSGVPAYGPNIENDAFSTDAFGFRRGVLDGQTYDFTSAFSGQPYAVVLGSSHVFGFGLEGDAQTLPSQLAARCKMPCLNVSFPEAQLQTLHAVTLRICAQAPRPPAFIAVLPGGMLTRYAYVRACDPLFGVPDFQRATPDTPAPETPAEAAAFGALLTYTLFWLHQLASLAKTQGIPLLIHPESTAFEKPTLSETETACHLTQPPSEGDRLRFDTHRLRYDAYTAAIMNNLPADAHLARCDPATLTYFDEFHYTSDAIGKIADALAAA